MNRPRILLADDNEQLVERVAGHLASSFNVVGIAYDGQELVSKALRLVPDVIVADITMPVLTGVEAIRQLQGTGLGLEVCVSYDSQRRRIPSSLLRGRSHGLRC